MTYTISNPASGVVLGDYDGETGMDAIEKMMKDAGHSVITIQGANSFSSGVDAYDVMTWDSEEDAENDDGQKATTRAVLEVTPA